MVDTSPSMGNKSTANTAISMPHQPKLNIQKKHRVVSFGSIHKADTPEAQKLYEFTHQRFDLRISRGVIPVGFISFIALEDGQEVHLDTKAGTEYDMFGGYVPDMGPQYRIKFKSPMRQEMEVLATSSQREDGWYSNLDELWTNVLAQFERRNFPLSEDTLDYLDADPFVLFGIDDPQVTQQALLKLETFPALRCEGSTPTFEEWAMYLRVNPEDRMMRWLVQAFAETELPKPWTCYKGVGSIVCYIRADSGQVKWRHPFYDYFEQLVTFCRSATREEVMQVRVNRLLWSYEATRVATEHDQEPLISPGYISRMADIFGYDITQQGCLVRNLKAQLKAFARSYCDDCDVKVDDILKCRGILQRDVEKYQEMCAHWSSHIKDEESFELDQLSNGSIKCVNCNTIALCFCLECKDYLCLNCYSALHAKGERLKHAPFRLVPCSLCVEMPAKLHCAFTDKSLCHECYAMKHIKMLPNDGKENHPRRIDYVKQYHRYATFAGERAASMVPALPLEDIHHEEDEYDHGSVLSTDWHPFYDNRGVKFYHNFQTKERMRQSPRRLPNTADPGAPEELPAIKDMTQTGMSRTGGVAVKDNSASTLTGFDSLETKVRAVDAAAAEVQIRELRPPHRVHHPSEYHAG